jgi:hypothetical protein
LESHKRMTFVQSTIFDLSKCISHVKCPIAVCWWNIYKEQRWPKVLGRRIYEVFQWDALKYNSLQSTTYIWAWYEYLSFPQEMSAFQIVDVAI